MADGDTTLDSNGDEVLDFDGDLFLEKTVGAINSCHCHECVDAYDCTRCYGNGGDYVTTPRPWCGYECPASIDITFGTITLDAGASGQPYYAVAQAIVAQLSGQTVTVPRDITQDQVGIFWLNGPVAMISGGYSYSWMIYIDAFTWLNPLSGTLKDVNWTAFLGISRGPAGALCVGDELPTCPGGKTRAYLGNFLGLMSIGSWRGDCEGTFADHTPDSFNTDYFSAFGDLLAFSTVPCTATSTGALPSSISIDTSQFLNGCHIFTGVDALPLGTDGLHYGNGLLHAEAPPGFAVYNLLALLYYDGRYSDLTAGVRWVLVFSIVIGGSAPIGCPTSKTYEKLTGLDDPTGTYTEVGGSGTVDIT